MLFLLFCNARDPGPGYVYGVAGGRTHPLVQKENNAGPVQENPGMHERHDMRPALAYAVIDYESMTTGPAVNDV
jgi:hypothetical protein